jgi:hypothetical protein
MMRPTTPTNGSDVATLINIRRARAQALCDAMDEEAGTGRVLSGMCKVWIFTQANDVQDRYCRGGDER